MSTSQRHTFYFTVSLGVICSVLLLSFFTKSIREIVISHADCQESLCRYSFTVDSPLSMHVYLYGVVKNAAQTHTKYSTPDTELIYKFKKKHGSNINIKNIEQCKPYRLNGKWVYPCGVIMSTYPQDKYIILTEQKKEVPILSDKKAQLVSWMNPSSFLAGKYKIGEVKSMQPGKYTLIVQKQLEHPLPNRNLLIIGNIGVFGTIFHNIKLHVITATILLALVNSAAYMYYV